MREDIDFKGADRESDFWLIPILCHGGRIHARSTRWRRNYMCQIRGRADNASVLFMACGGKASGRDRILMGNFYFNSDFRQCSVCKILWIYISITTTFSGEILAKMLQIATQGLQITKISVTCNLSFNSSYFFDYEYCGFKESIYIFLKMSAILQ